MLNEQHLRRLLTKYVTYYHRFRTHLSLDMDCPEPRAVEPPESGEVIAVPERPTLPLQTPGSVKENSHRGGSSMRQAPGHARRRAVLLLLRIEVQTRFFILWGLCQQAEPDLMPLVETR